MLSSFRPGTHFLGPGVAGPALAVSMSSAASWAGILKVLLSIRALKLKSLNAAKNE